MYTYNDNATRFLRFFVTAKFRFLACFLIFLTGACSVIDFNTGAGFMANIRIAYFPAFIIFAFCVVFLRWRSWIRTTAFLLFCFQAGAFLTLSGFPIGLCLGSALTLCVGMGNCVMYDEPRP